MACKSGKCKINRERAQKLHKMEAQQKASQSSSLKQFSPIQQPGQQAREEYKKKPWYKRVWQKLKELGWGTSDINEFLKTVTPEQESALFEQLEGGKKNIDNPYEGFGPIKDSALSTFFQDIVPRLQTQFSASGENAISSPILQTNLSSAGADLSQRLAAMQAEYGQQNKQFGLNQIQTGLQNVGTPYHTPGKSGLVPSLFKAASGGIGKGVGLGIKSAISKALE